MQRDKKHTRGSKALEIAMRDVMSGLEESFCVYAYQPISDCMEILSIEAPADACSMSAKMANVLSLEHNDPADISAYLIKREQLLAKLTA